MADRGKDHRAVRPSPVLNGTMTGPSKMTVVGNSYAVWRASLVINLRVKRLLLIVTGNDDDDDSDDDEIQPSVQRRQARAAHKMTSNLGIGPFLFILRRQQRSCGHTSHHRHKVARHRHVVYHVSRKRVHREEVSSWSAPGDVCRRVRRTGRASGRDWSRCLGIDARCQFPQLAV
jgi:hypothetical protein